MQIAKCQHHVDVVDAKFENVDDVHATLFRMALMSCRFQEFDVFKSWFGKYAFLDPAGLVKSILVMTSTSAVARLIGLDNPQSAIVFGGLMGTTSGVTAGLAATDPKPVPYWCDVGDVLYRRRMSDCTVGAVPGCQGDARVALRVGDIPTK